ncbi:hypothetical protein BerOc1_01554 [Pseudodesulfovibrio hydrargyri]|uniref:Uncharacterized protein n=1 Tax=Pseudodesulfovibrio hydrargyri TaxID=2125990 RepID=A0A1J5MSP9_9BACT|nr:hypothetical protein [Pseudodesulfovibrio hydrargyri]OIQ49629.1 hypothetical protein BerOc1_01554 [Pseudodesulfovibrio hydrargyri]
MIRTVFALVVILALPLPLLAAGTGQCITKFETDPVAYFVKSGNGFTLGGDLAVSELPPVPVPVVKAEPGGYLMIEHNGQPLWFDPMDVATDAQKTADKCRKTVGNPPGLKPFGSPGIGEN